MQNILQAPVQNILHLKLIERGTKENTSQKEEINE